MRPTPTSRTVRFGQFEAELDNARLRRNGVRIRLQDQPFRILALLLDRPGQLVSRDELRRALWPEGTYVDFDRSLNAAITRLRTALNDGADNPRFIETIPKRGYRFIAPVIEDRVPAPPAPAPGEPEPAVSAAGLPSELPQPHARWFRSWMSLALLAVATLALVLVIRQDRRRIAVLAPEQRSAPVLARRSVAVLGFQNVSGRPADAWLSTALGEMLRTDLSSGGQVRVVPGEDVAQLGPRLPWNATDSLGQSTASRLGHALGTDWLVLGSVATLGKSGGNIIRVDFRLEDAATGDILFAGAESGTQGQFFNLAAQIGADLRAAMKLPAVQGNGAAGLVASLPSNPEAARLYALGLDHLRDDDVAAAKDLLQQASALAPHFAMAHLMLSRAWSGLGYDQKAKAEAAIALQQSAGLPEPEKLQIAGSYYAIQPDPDKAISADRALFSLQPDSVDAGEQLIAALNRAGRNEEALQVVRQLRALPPLASADPRLDYWEAQVTAAAKGPAIQALLEKAAEEAQARGQTLLYAHLRLSQCLSLVYGPVPQGAREHCQQAYDLFMSAGIHLFAADALRAMGDEVGGAGDVDGARALYRRALALLAPLGEHEKTGVVLNNMAIGYENQGNVTEAAALFRRAAASWAECGDVAHAGTARGNLGDVLMLRGQLPQAESLYEQAQQQIESVYPNGIAYLLYSRANLRLDAGDLAGARQLARQAMQLARSDHNVGDMAADGLVTGGILMSAGDLSGAEASLREALRINQRRNNALGLAEDEAALGQVWLEAGKPAQAEPQFNLAMAQFRAQNSALDEVQTEIELSRALLGAGKVAAARREIANALVISSAQPFPYLRLPEAIQEARVAVAEAAGGGAGAALAEAESKLRWARAEALRLGFYQIGCEAKLALAQLAMRQDPARARASLRELASDAHRHGFELMARRAAAAAGGGS